MWYKDCDLCEFYEPNEPPRPVRLWAYDMYGRPTLLDSPEESGLEYWTSYSCMALAGYAQVSEHDAQHLCETAEDGENLWPGSLIAWEE